LLNIPYSGTKEILLCIPYTQGLTLKEEGNITVYSPHSGKKEILLCLPYTQGRRKYYYVFPTLKEEGNIAVYSPHSGKKEILLCVPTLREEENIFVFPSLR
jgi:hypothetical protein